MCRVIQAQLPRSESSASQAALLVRASVEEWVPETDPAVAEAAEQMTRALVTNAVVHALSPVRLVIALRGGVLEVGVSDTDATLPGSRVPAQRIGSRGWGRGLTLVDTLSDEWGSTPLRVGKQVWFTLAVGAAPERDACRCAADAPGAVRLGSGASVVSPALAPEPS
jgi:anti-sigma regulatory factor (Ser/Thr protein kinase)